MMCSAQKSEVAKALNALQYSQYPLARSRTIVLFFLEAYLLITGLRADEYRGVASRQASRFATA